MDAALSHGANSRGFFLSLHMKFYFLTVSILTLPLAAAEVPVSFNRDIRPIMSDTCFHCHGFDAKARKAGLRLDLREEAMKPMESGETPIVPGKPEKSEIITRLFSTDEEEIMPPVKAHKPFTSQQKELMKRWVAEGAKYEPHWAYAPLVRPALPQVGVPHPIDAFVLEKLAGKKITPSPEASRERLLRRLSLDLTGLPPSVEEMAAFIGDVSADAYGRQVKRLLASPQFGERMAVWWLDVARFADTVGFHGDQNQRIFPYRDYVIAAFNGNKPFDQFTVEQLAGDLLPNPTPEQLVATGYNRLNMMTREGGAQAKEYLAKYGAERVRAVAAAWFGSTFGCAECHDHKFDPIKTRDFYELQSFFADVKQWGVYSDYGYTPVPELKGFDNDHPFPPEIEVESAYLQAREAQARAELSQHLTKSVDEGKLATWEKESREFLQRQPDGWTRPALNVARYKDGKPLENGGVEVGDELAVPFDIKTGDGEELHISLRPGAGRVAAVRMQLGEKFTTEPEMKEMKFAAMLQRAGGQPVPLAIHFADADANQPRYSGGQPVVGVTKGWRLPKQKPGQVFTTVWVLDEPVELHEEDRLVLTVSDEVKATLRFSVSPFAALDPLRINDESARKALLAALEKRGDAERQQVAERWLCSTQADRPALQKAREMAAAIRQFHGGKAWSLVTKSAEPLTVRVLPRGNWQDETGAVVLPATPSFLPGRLESTPERRLTRLDLARWIVSKENPIAARTVMNRLWQPFFGTALSAAVDDLGSQGEWPSHPELLDWLACEFRESGWDVKHMVELIVTSATYRQSSNLRPELKDLDPSNRLLASQNPRRLEAEFVRDNALRIAGLLDTKLIGGPSAKPYQPAGHFAGLQFPDRGYLASNADEQWRRGIYMHWQRTFLHPMLVNFDAPSRDECAALRTVSNTPQQALTLLNDPTFVEASRAFASRLLAEKSDSDSARVDRAFQIAVGHPAKAKDRERLVAFLGEQRKQYAAAPDDAQKLLHIGIAPQPANDNAIETAAWTQVCRVLLNAQETITRY